MQKPATTYNPWFLLPFTIWVVVGGFLLWSQGDEVLFRYINLHHTYYFDVVMYYTTMLGGGAIIVSVLLILFAVKAFRNWWYFTAAALCNVIPSLITQIIKRQVNAPRPLKFFNEADWVHILPHWSRHMENSFPSGHTCGAFAFFTLLAILLPDKHRAWGLLLFIIALLVGYSRVYLAVHFFADVYVGSIIGTLLVLLIITLLNRFQHLFFKK